MRARDLGDKRVIYQGANVPCYWIVDPTNRSIQVYRLTTDGYRLDISVVDRGFARLPPFEAVELELEALFSPRRLKARRPVLPRAIVRIGRAH